jgi:hypothetical protein
LSTVIAFVQAFSENNSDSVFNLTPEGIRNEAVNSTISAVDLYVESDISNGIKSSTRAAVFFNILLEDSTNSDIMPPHTEMDEIMEVLKLLSDPPDEVKEYLQMMDSEQRMGFITFLKIFEIKVRAAFKKWMPNLMDKSTIKTPIIERQE